MAIDKLKNNKIVTTNNSQKETYDAIMAAFMLCSFICEFRINPKPDGMDRIQLGVV